MSTSLDPKQLAGARVMVLVLFVAHLVALLSLLVELLVFATMAATGLACLGLTRLPLGHQYRWLMASAALAAVGMALAGALAHPGVGPWHEAPAALTLASGFFNIAAPLLLCQAMLLFSRRAGFAGLEPAWHRARFALSVAYGSWIVLVAVEHFSEELSATLGNLSASVQLALIMLVSAAGLLVLLFLLQALFRTQRELAVATRRAAGHATPA